VPRIVSYRRRCSLSFVAGIDSFCECWKCIFATIAHPIATGLFKRLILFRYIYKKELTRYNIILFYLVVYYLYKNIKWRIIKDKIVIYTAYFIKKNLFFSFFSEFYLYCCICFVFFVFKRKCFIRIQVFFIYYLKCLVI